MTEKILEKRLLKRLVDLEAEGSKLPSLPEEEAAIIEADNHFESVYFSNRLEGNHLTEKETRDAIFTDDL